MRFSKPLSIKMVAISSNSRSINNTIISMCTEGDLIIIILPFAKLAASTRAADLVTGFFCKLHVE